MCVLVGILHKLTSCKGSKTCETIGTHFDGFIAERLQNHTHMYTNTHIHMHTHRFHRQRVNFRYKDLQNKDRRLCYHGNLLFRNPSESSVELQVFSSCQKVIYRIKLRTVTHILLHQLHFIADAEKLNKKSLLKKEQPLHSNTF